MDRIIYAIGGAPDANGPALSSVEANDPTTDTWTKSAEMPTARLAFATAVVDGIIYAVGGTAEESNSGAILATVEAYDPGTDTWTTWTDMPTTRHFHSASVVARKIYVMGGRIRHTSLPEGNGFATVEEYTPEESLRESWDYVVLGDSFAARSEYAELYAAHIEEDLGVEIELHERASSGQPTEANLDRVLNNEALRNLVAEAEVITISWSPSSLDAPEKHT